MYELRVEAHARRVTRAAAAPARVTVRRWATRSFSVLSRFSDVVTLRCRRLSGFRATITGWMSRFHETASQGAPSGYEGARLHRKPTLTWNDGRGRQSREITESLVLGGAEGVDLVIADPAVSRLHAELELLDSGLWVHDLESR